jgi:hypothetical protein
MRLYCDYNSATEDGRYWVLGDLNASGVELRAGMAVTLYARGTSAPMTPATAGSLTGRRE